MQNVITFEENIKAYTIINLLLFLILPSCKKGTQNSQLDKSDIYGDWEYKEDERTLEFTFTSDGQIIGIEKFESDHILIKTGSFQILSDQIISVNWERSGDYKYEVLFPDTFIYWINASKLELIFQTYCLYQISGNQGEIINSSFYKRNFSAEGNFYNHKIYSFKQDEIITKAALTFDESMPEVWETDKGDILEIGNRTITLSNWLGPWITILGYYFEGEKIYFGNRHEILLSKQQ